MALQNPNKIDHGDMGEIYKATNKSTGKSYIGQAPLFMGINMQNWGGHARWTRHILEATSERTIAGKNTDINKAIRKYGKDMFDLEILCTVDKKDLDDMEIKYIKEYNTIEPNGYNMTTGGKNGRHSEASNKKLKVLRKKNTAINTIDTSSDTSENNNTIDTSLPKHVYAVKKKGKIIGYRIIKFKIDPESDETVNASFIDANNPENELKKVTEYVNKLQVEFMKNKEKYDKKNKLSQAILDDIKKLPKNIFPIIDESKEVLQIRGYYVSGLKSYDGIDIPKRDFTEFTNVHNLDNCRKFINLIESFNSKKKKPDDWQTIDIPKRIKNEKLPNYMRETYHKGIHNGYRIDYYLGYDENKKQIIERKCFTSNKLSMEEKYNLAIAYLTKLEKSGS